MQGYTTAFWALPRLVVVNVLGASRCRTIRFSHLTNILFRRVAAAVPNANKYPSSTLYPFRVFRIKLCIKSHFLQINALSKTAGTKILISFKKLFVNDTT